MTLTKDRPKLIDGEVFLDHRGIISSLNKFSFEGVERFYFIRHNDHSVIRGWHGHQLEKKWFYCVKGSFHVGLVEPDDWDNPSKDLSVSVFTLKESKSQILFVPGGYANCIKANEADSILLVLSGNRFENCHLDSWRYDQDLWINWESIN